MGRWLLVLAVFAAMVSPSRAEAQDATCSMDTAVAVAGPTNPFNPGVSEPIAQVLCGPFAGAGSNSMAVSFTAATCWGTQTWAIYVYTNGTWKRILDVPSWLAQPLFATPDGGIREVAPVFGRHDPRCVPSGGTRGRTWKWNGSRFVAGAWKHTRQHVLLGRVACMVQDDGTPTGTFAYCWTNKRRHARLGLDGAIDTTTYVPPPMGLGGPEPRIGSIITAGRVRCQYRRAHTTCWVRATGKGMRVNHNAKATPIQVK